MNCPDIKTITQAFTHNGIFHADDVFSSALLLMLNSRIRIERGGKVPETYEGIVFDIGAGRFDHHQANKRVRKNGIPYAAFGLLWEEYGELLLAAEDARQFDRDFVQALDEADNTGKENLLAQCISDWNPQWNEPEADVTKRFEEAVEWAGQLLDAKFRAIWAKREAFTQIRLWVQEQSSPILWLEKAMPWKEAVKGTGIFYVCFPSMRGGYAIQAVPKDDGEIELKKPFPAKWRGKTAEELRILTGIETFGFCHNSGFLCAADTSGDAARVARMAMEYKEPGEDGTGRSS